MRVNILAAGLCVSGCQFLGPVGAPKTVAAYEKPAGQLFCAIATDGGGQIVVGVIDAAASVYAGPLAGPVIVAATGATAAAVQSNCSLAAAAVGAKAGVPVSPPAFPVPNVAVQPVKT